MSGSKLLSLIVAGLYLLIIYLVSGDFLHNPRTLFMPLIGLACIWIGDKKGGRRKTIPGLQIYPPSSGFMLRFMGWIFLILPFIIFIVATITDKYSFKSG